MRTLRLTFVLVLWAAIARPAIARQTSSVPAPPPPGQVSPPALEGPATDLEPIPPDEPVRRPAVAREPRADEGMTDDALNSANGRKHAVKVYAPHQPPAQVAERPALRRPSPRAVWVPGYWEWDQDHGEFVWTGGDWQVPPTGMIWVGGRWLRDERGWYRVAGLWSPRRGAGTDEPSSNPSITPDWRLTGPPANQPPDTAAAAPGPDYFFVAGHYEPDAGSLTWKPGFWARTQPGWDWVPARWVRRATGWEFRPGDWVRESEPTDLKVTIDGRRTPDRALGTNEPPLPEDTDGDPEMTTEADRPDRSSEGPRRVVVVPGPGMPYYVIRPPGSFPYGPGGVIVPGVVPRFVRRILDDVLP